MTLLALLFILIAVFNIMDPDSAYKNVSYPVTGIQSATFNPENGDIYLYDDINNYLISITEESRIDTLSILEFDDKNKKLIDTHPSGNSILFWDSGVGKVHSYYLNTDTFIRLDNSFSHKNQFGHAAFVDEKGRINAMGGYGFWTYKNFMTRYEHTHKEWEMTGSEESYTQVIKSNYGMLFKDNTQFYYIVQNSGDSVGSPLVYQCNYPENRWSENSDYTSLFSDFSLRKPSDHNWFRHTSTYRLNRGNGNFGFLTAANESQFFNLFNPRNNRLHRINTHDLGIYDARAVFYSSRLDRWIILGHPYSSSRQNQLIIHTFQFQENHPWVSTVDASVWFQSPYIVGSAIISLMGLLFLFHFGRITIKKKRSGNPKPYKHTHPVEIHETNLQHPDVFFQGEKFNFIGDPYLTKMINVIHEMTKTGSSEILISDLDQKLFPENTHSSYRSRNRKKLISIINNSSGVNLIEQKRSQTDKRVKIFTLNMKLIKIVN